MSGLEVIGGIGAVIGIIDASVKIWDKAQRDIQPPETFKIVARRLPPPYIHPTEMPRSAYHRDPCPRRRRIRSRYRTK